MGPGPKRPRRGEAGFSAQPSTALPEAILVEDGEGEENPPTGVPINDVPQASLPDVAPPPVKDAGGPPRTSPVGLTSQKGADASASSGASKSPAPPSRTSDQGGAYKSHLSETVLKLAILPKFQAIMKGLPLEESFDTMFSAALQMSNGLFVLRDNLVSANSQLSDAKARELKALDDLRAAQEVNRAWRERGEKELQVLDAKLSEVMARLLPTEEKLKDTVLKLEHAENRADTAEAVARDAAEKLVLAEKEAKEASDKLAAMEVEAQERAAVAEARVQKAVEEYKGSPDFASELHEAAVDSFVQGFERCKRRLSRRFNLKDLEQFRPADDEETSDVEAADMTVEPNNG